MTKNPLINAISATLYIVFVATIMFYGSNHAPKHDTFLAPVALISLFTLSASAMGYIFLYQPFQLYFDGKKKQALNLFLQTVAIFGATTLIFLIILFSGLIGGK